MKDPTVRREGGGGEIVARTGRGHDQSGFGFNLLLMFFGEGTQYAGAGPAASGGGDPTGGDKFR